MATYYLDPDASGADTGASKTDAWSTLQRAIDGTGGTQPAAGDTVECRHGTGNDEQPGATIDWDGNSGTNSSGIIWKGMNSSWVDDGTKYIIDGGGHAGALWTFASEYHYIKNFELNNAATDTLVLEGAVAHPMIFHNCIFHNPGSACFDTYSGNLTFYKCHFTSAGVDGAYRPYGHLFIFCVFADNTGDGIDIYHAATSAFYGCVFHNNGGAGINAEAVQLLFNCVIDGNTGDGLQLTGNRSPAINNPYGAAIGCRITGNAKGLDIDARAFEIIEDYNYINNNSTETEGVLFAGDNTLQAGTDGYNDVGNDDFNLTTSATLRRTSVDLGLGS